MITIDKKTKLFFRWLKNQGLYGEYIDEFLACYYRRKNNGYTYSNIYYYANAIIVKHIERVIDASLVWANTKRGRTFWSIKHDEWRKYFSLYKKQNEKRNKNVYSMA